MACIISEEVHWCSTFRLCGEHSKRTKQDDRLFCWRWGLGGTGQWEEWLIGSWRSQVEQTEKSWWWERLLEGEWCKGCFVVLFWLLCAIVFCPEHWTAWTNPVLHINGLLLVSIWQSQLLWSTLHLCIGKKCMLQGPELYRKIQDKKKQPKRYQYLYQTQVRLLLALSRF